MQQTFLIQRFLFRNILGLALNELHNFGLSEPENVTEAPSNCNKSGKNKNFFILRVENARCLIYLCDKADENVLNQGYRDRYDIIDHGHEKKIMYFFHRSIFTKIREFTTIVLWKLVIHFGYRGCNCTGVYIIS